MTRKTFGVCALLVIVLAWIGSAAAADKKPERTWGDVTLTGDGVSNERQSAKLEEYKDYPNITGDFTVMHEPDGKHYFWLKGTEVGAEDQRYQLDAGQFGAWKLKLSFDETPHRFAYDAHYLYSGIGTSELRLPAGLQAALQGKSTTVQAQQLINNFEPGANLFDLALFRHRTKASFDLLSMDPLTWNLTYRQENRTGDRPLMGTFGFSAAVEIAEPVDYVTRDWSTSADYVRKNWSVGAKYAWSTFDNNNVGLVFDNPLRAADGGTATGARQGEIALYPSNTFNALTLNGTFGASPWNSRFSWMGSWGRGKQNDPLLPFTTNQGISFGGVNLSTLAALPFASVDHTVDTALYDVSWNARPGSAWGLRARYRSYEWQDKTPEVTFSDWVAYDQGLKTGLFTPDSPKFRDRTLSLYSDFDIFKKTVLTVGWENLFSAKNGREVTTQNENTYKVSVDNHTRDWLTLRASYLMATRGGNYDYTIPNGLQYGETTNTIPFYRRWDVARRDRNDLQLQATAVLSEAASLSGMFITGADIFPDSDFGVSNDHHTIVGLDTDVEANRRCTLTGFVSREYLTTLQRGHQWNPPGAAPTGGVGDPYKGAAKQFDGSITDPSNWTEEEHSVVDTIGAGMKLNLKPKKRDIELSGSYSKTDGSIDFGSLVGTAGKAGVFATDTNPFFPMQFNAVDSAKIFNLNAKYKAQLAKDYRLTIGWLWQRLALNDFDYQGFKTVSVTTAGAYNSMLLAGTLPQSYDADVIYANLTYKF